MSLIVREILSVLFWA